jgi:hypothetical protein
MQIGRHFRPAGASALGHKRPSKGEVERGPLGAERKRKPI